MLFTDITKKLDALKLTADSIKSQPADISDFHEKIAKVSRGQEEKTRIAEHVNILEAIQDKVNGKKLSLTQLEQVVATDNDSQQMLDLVLQAIRNPTTSEEDALRLSLIYSLHFDGQGIDQIDNALGERFVADSKRFLLQKINEYAGSLKRGGDDELFGNKSKMAQLLKTVKSFKQANEDQYDLFKSLVFRLIKKISEGQLKEETYPFVQKNNMCSVKPSKVIIFVAGGVTYEEARVAGLLSTKDFEVIVGGTDVINAKQFIEYELL